jgi:hypothetical protein
MDLQRQNWLGIALIAASVLAVAAMFVIGVILEGRRVQRNAQTSCVEGQLPPGHIVLIIDKSEPLSSRQVQLLEFERDRVLEAVREDELVSVYVIDDEASTAIEPRFALCSPGSERDANPLYQNPGRYEQNFEEKFARRFNEVIDELKEPVTSPHSPIFEAIKGVSLAPELSAGLVRRDVIIISDMLQNVPEYTHYNGTPLDWGSFAKTAYYRRVKADLSGVDVRVVYLRRREDVDQQSDEHVRFWNRYFAESGATPVRLQFR